MTHSKFIEILFHDKIHYSEENRRKQIIYIFSETMISQEALLQLIETRNWKKKQFKIVYNNTVAILFKCT